MEEALLLLLPAVCWGRDIRTYARFLASVGLVSEREVWLRRF